VKKQRDQEKAILPHPRSAQYLRPGQYLRAHEKQFPISIKVGFITPDISPSEPRRLELPAVPRVGDQVTLDSGKVYQVARVHWSYTSKGFGTVEVHLELAD
jgi:hypothetical protein